MSERDRDRWNEKYSQCSSPVNQRADEWLLEACAKIARSTPGPKASGRAVDLACGRGQNAIWLARHGWTVDGIDISAAGLRAAEESATQSGCSVNWIEADLDDWCPVGKCYDLAIVFRFLDRVTIPRIITSCLNPGGWLIYETFSAGLPGQSKSHIRNPAFLLTPGELPELFPRFRIETCLETTVDNHPVQRFLAQIC